MLLKVFWAPRTGSRDPGASLSVGIEEMQRKMKGFRGEGLKIRAAPLGARIKEMQRKMKGFRGEAPEIRAPPWEPE